MHNETMTWKDWDAEYICDRIERLCQAFGIEVDWRNFAGVSTFGDICDVICVSVAWRYRDGGALQQSFYQLRAAIAELNELDIAAITPETTLEELFPLKGRRLQIRRLEKILGLRLHLLAPKKWIVISTSMVTVVGFFSILAWWQLGLIGLVAGSLGYCLAVWFGSELRLATMGEVSMELARNGHIYRRGEPGRVNPDEIEKIIEDWFRKELRLATVQMKRDTVIF